jgi:glyoxylate/hydroxypyruvate reductase A
MDTPAIRPQTVPRGDDRRRKTRAVTLLFSSPVDDPAPWLAAFAREMPELEVRVWPNAVRFDDVEFALVWKPPRGLFPRLSGLRAILSLGAGVEHLLEHPELPPGLPIARMVDESLRIGMTEFVVMRVLHYHRRMPEYEEQQRTRVWRQLPQRAPKDRRVGILGLGVLGASAASALAGLGFDVGGWSRTLKSIPAVTSHTGEDGLFALLERTEILVCLLPLTGETRGIIDRTTLNALPRGAYVINAARGGHVVDEDLLAALASGHIAGATLDVFNAEPLPPEHPYWTNPKVTVVPHVAAWTLADIAIHPVIENIRRFRAGRPMLNLVDRKRGY